MATEHQSSIPPEYIHVGKDGTIYDKREQGMFSHLLTPQPTIQAGTLLNVVAPGIEKNLNGQVAHNNADANPQDSTELQFFTGKDGTVYDMSERGILSHLLTVQPTTQPSAASTPSSRK